MIYLEWKIYNLNICLIHPEYFRGNIHTVRMSCDFISTCGSDSSSDEHEVVVLTESFVSSVHVYSSRLHQLQLSTITIAHGQ